MKSIFKKRPLITMTLLALLLSPAGVAFAGYGAEFPSQTITQTAIPTIAPTVTPVPQQAVSLPSVLSPIPGLLQTDVQPQMSDAADTFTFEQFGLYEITMRGPFATNGYYFDLPVTWKMKSGAVLHLSLDTYFTGSTGTSLVPGAIAPSNYIGSLEVQYNYNTIGKVDLTAEGRTEVDIPIPLDVINRYGSNQGHSILFILDSQINCLVDDSNTTLVVRPTSQLYMPHDLVDPPVDLRFLPFPFYQDSFNPNSAIIIVPDQPTAEELQAAMSVAAGFGSMTYNALSLSLLPLSQATKEVLESSNLIFVGRAENIPQVQQISLPLKLSNGSFASSDMGSDDGVVQMAVSPWNDTKVVLVVSGNSDNGVVKASQAVSTGGLQVGVNSSLSLVSDVKLIDPIFDVTDVNQTFADLGYDSLVVDQVGLNVLNYTFNIPPNYLIGPDAYLDLNFSHSALLEYQRSTIVVNLNGQPIGSVRLSDATATEGNAKIVLPASAARSGANNLRLDINLEPINQCVNPLLNGLWMRIDSSSSLHLPFVPNVSSTVSLIDLSKFPFPFSFDPLMKDLAFVLSENDPIGWNVAAQIASQLGNTNRAQLAGVDAYYASSIPDNVKQERSLIVVGQPNKLDILSDLYNVLPAPFEAGSNFVTQRDFQVLYNLGSGADVGYLELLAAPWNSNRTILYVGGSSDLGVRWAGAALQLGRLRSQLKGNLSFINGEQVISVETRVLQSDQSILSTPKPSVVTDPSKLQEVAIERPAWIMPAILIAFGGIILVLVVLAIQKIFKKPSGK